MVEPLRLFHPTLCGMGGGAEFGAVDWFVRIARDDALLFSKETDGPRAGGCTLRVVVRSAARMVVKRGCVGGV